MPETFVDHDTGIQHEIIGHGDSVPMWLLLSCRTRVPPQFGPSNIGNGPITCLDCIAGVDMHDVRCEYCGKKTGETSHAWATEDICDGCAGSNPHGEIVI